MKRKPIRKPLPSDVTELQSLVRQQQEQIDYLMHMLFGRRSEKVDPSQPTLFEAGELDRGDDVESSDPSAEPEPEAESLKPPRRPQRRRRHVGRNPLPEHLKRCVHIIDPPEEELTCPCCQARKEPFAEEVTEELEMQPIQAHVNQYVRRKFACPSCKGHVASPPQPKRAMNKGIPGPGFLAHLVASKFVDGLPLYRQQQIYLRWGLRIARSTMGDWVAYVAQLLEPVVESMKARLCRSRMIFTDDTPIRVLGPPRHRKLGRFWVYISEGNEVIFDYTEDRSRKGPLSMLAGFEGYLHADAFSGYDAVYAPGGVLEVACWAHARRKFYDAQASGGKHARRMLDRIGRLYAVESRLRRLRERLEEANRFDQEAYDRLVLKWRQRYSVRRLERIRAELDWLATFALPRSLMGKALRYVANQWKALTRYTEASYLEIDNNHSERQIKQLVIGRKNFLFCGSDPGARNAAVLYSLMVTCRLHGVDPEAYLRDVLLRIHDHPGDRMAELSPPAWSRRFGSPDLSSTQASVA